MQGRLLPPEGGKLQCFPRAGWIREFQLAQKAQLDSIEWIYDVWGEEANPIWSDSGIQQLKALARKCEVVVTSVCADYFMERPLIRTSSEERCSRIQFLTRLIRHGKQLDITRI